jgi:hypothetical protein
MSESNNYQHFDAFARLPQRSHGPTPKTFVEAIVNARADLEFGVSDLVFAIFFYARHLPTLVDRALCHRIVSYIYAEYGPLLGSTHFEMRDNLIFNREVDSAIDRLASLSYIESVVNDTCRITESGLWQYDASVAPKIVKSTLLIPVVSTLRFALTKFDASDHARASKEVQGI